MYLVAICRPGQIDCQIRFCIDKRMTSLHKLVPNEPIREGPEVHQLKLYRNESNSSVLETTKHTWK